MGRLPQNITLTFGGKSLTSSVSTSEEKRLGPGGRRDAGFPLAAVAGLLLPPLSIHTLEHTRDSQSRILPLY